MYKSYKICQHCNKPIFRNGLIAQPKKGGGYGKGKHYHNYCFKRFINVPKVIYENSNYISSNRLPWFSGLCNELRNKFARN